MRWCAVFLLAFAPATVWAHGLSAEIAVRQGHVVLELFFGDGSTPSGAKVVVRSGGVELTTGKTDENGVFIWRPPGPGTYQLVATEPGLHKITKEIVVPVGAIVDTPPPREPRDVGPPVARAVYGLAFIAVLAGLLHLVRRGFAAPGPWLSAVDDRARLVAMLALTLCLGAVTSALRLDGLSLALTLTLVCRVSPRVLLARLWPLLALLVPLALVTPLWHPDGAHLLFEGWTWGPTDRGLDETILVASRVLAMALVAVAALEAAPFDRTIKALQDLRVPQALTHTALLTYRYAYVFLSDLSRLRASLATRGFRARPSPATVQTYAAVTGGLLLRSMERTERVEHAMRCRGYRGALRLEPRPGLALSDVLLVLYSVGLGAGLVLMDRGVFP